MNNETIPYRTYNFSGKRNPYDITIAVDIDNILNNFTEVWVDILNEKYSCFGSPNVWFDSIKEYDIKKSFPQLSNKQIYSVVNTKKFYRNLEPIRGSMIGLELLNRKYNVIIVTSTWIDNIKNKSNWLLKNFPFLDESQIVVCRNKQNIKCDIMIDDCLDNLLGGDYFKILMDYPWNHNKVIDKKIERLVRADDWFQIYEYIKRYEIEVGRLDKLVDRLNEIPN